MNVLIVDDEQPARERLKRMLEEMGSDYHVVGEASNGKQALELAQSLEPAIVLLDIRMPVMDGIEAARHITHLDRPPAVIFTTAYSDHALEAFETHAVAYLVKPIRDDKLVDALKAASRITRAQALDIERSEKEHAPGEHQRTHICARVRGNLKLIALDDIYYFQAGQKYVTVRHRGGEVLIEEPLKSLENEFANEFFRIHRNALVAYRFVAGMEKNRDGRHLIIFEDVDDQLEVSRRHVAGVRKTLKTV